MSRAPNRSSGRWTRFSKRTSGQIRTQKSGPGIAMPTKAEKPAKNATTKRGYRDLHEHLAALDEAGLLVTIDEPVNKDTEMHPLVRWQFRVTH